MGSVTERIHDGCKVIGYLIAQLNDIRFGDRDILGKTAVFTHDTDRDRVLAYMPHASTAVTAMTASNMTFSRHAFAYFEVLHADAYPCHFAYELMTHRVRRFAMCLRPGVPFIHVQVRSADSGFLHLDEYIIDSHFGHRNVFHPDARLGIFLN